MGNNPLWYLRLADNKTDRWLGQSDCEIESSNCWPMARGKGAVPVPACGQCHAVMKKRMSDRPCHCRCLPLWSVIKIKFYFLFLFALLFKRDFLQKSSFVLRSLVQFWSTIFKKSEIFPECWSRWDMKNLTEPQPLKVGSRHEKRPRSFSKLFSVFIRKSFYQNDIFRSIIYHSTQNCKARSTM